MSTKKRVVPDKITFYRDEWGEWRWRRIASNGKIVGASSESYVNKSYCMQNFYRQFDDDYRIINP